MEFCNTNMPRAIKTQAQFQYDMRIYFDLFGYDTIKQRYDRYRCCYITLGFPTLFPVVGVLVEIIESIKNHRNHNNKVIEGRFGYTAIDHHNYRMGQYEDKLNHLQYGDGFLYRCQSTHDVLICHCGNQVI